MQTTKSDFNSIHLLDSNVIDQIAAGEVVDRPAHMVKELCENSLDAGATEISIDFEQGGRRVLVQDNGTGIAPDQLNLALSRHATSKIQKSDDIWALSTYGFRGEALATIGAVSILKLRSKKINEAYSASITCRFGQLEDLEEVAGEVGTSVEVESLFENVPARLKFLKSDVGESSAIKNELKALALANPQVSFRILQSGKMLHYWPKMNSFLERAKQVFENENLFAGDFTIEDMSAHVVISSPNDTVKNSRQIWLFVKGRHITDRSLQAAVTEGYRNLLMHGEFPLAAIFVDCDPANIDVNVSPTKSLVKFKEPGMAFRVVHHAVRGVLESAPWLKSLLGAKVSVAARPLTNSDLDRAEIGSSIEQIKPPGPEVDAQKNWDRADSSFTQLQYKNVSFRAQQDEVLGRSTETIGSFELSETSKGSDHKSILVRPSVMSGEPSSANLWSDLAIIGQAHLTYIVAQKDDAIIFIDQHAAHERVLFEKIVKNHAEKGFEVQNFLLPIQVTLSEEAVAEMLQQQSEIEKLGIYFDAMGPTEIAVSGSPTLIKTEAIEPIFHKIAEECLSLAGSFAMSKVISHVAATMACHSAVRAGHALSEKEMKSLLVQMDDFPLSSFCPHGRPVYVEYPIQKLEREFGRIV